MDGKRRTGPFLETDPMKMYDFLEKDHERVMAEMQYTSSPDKVQQILEKEADRLLLQYNEDCRDRRVRDAAAGMMQALRSSAAFLDSAGDVQVWQRSEEKGGGIDKDKGSVLILLLAGLVLLLAVYAVPELLIGKTAGYVLILRGLLLPAAGGICLFLAGRKAGAGKQMRRGGKRLKGAAASPAAQRIEVSVDKEKIWNTLRGAVMVIDRNLEVIQEEEEYERHKELAAAAGARGITAEEISLFSDLLEAADADSPQIASDIRYYLHKKEVEVLPWTSQNAAWFEILPSVGNKAGKQAEVVTIRPALAQDGKLLKKGLAAKGGY